ncbi:glycosyltransferase family 39 protein [Candidatus Saccharibacteria bacterium]|nr:glycosyltransferase family 39 protein [Candidatus Saccharibacteria bacterium]
MKKHDATKRSLIYRWRYQIGYIGLAITLALALIFIALFSPGGLTEAEISSTITSHSVLTDPFSQNIIDAPYHLLQHASVSLFGLSIFSIKLPSLIIAFLSALGLVALLRRWYRPNTVFLAVAITITSSLFLFTAQSGTPAIMYIFWPIIILLLGAHLIDHTRARTRIIFSTLFLFTLGLSLYTPFMIYTAFALILGVIIHPHLRFTVKSFLSLKSIPGAVIFLITITPLIIATIHDYHTFGRLLVDTDLAYFNFFDNIRIAIATLFSFNHALDYPILTPAISLAAFALILIGLADSVKERYTAKNYILTIWSIFAIFIISLAPDRIVILFLPFTILIASSIKLILDKWYSLFPENPYARIGGLIPIAFFAFLAVTTSIEHFIYGNYYTPQVVRHFNSDISLVKSYTTDGSIILAPADSPEYRFYQILASQRFVTITSEIPAEIPSNLIILRSAHPYLEQNPHQLHRIITSRHTHNSDRLFIYLPTHDIIPE